MPARIVNDQGKAIQGTLGFVGDTADNIKGAEKAGIKTAAMLLEEFGKQMRF